MAKKEAKKKAKAKKVKDVKNFLIMAAMGHEMIIRNQKPPFSVQERGKYFATIKTKDLLAELKDKTTWWTVRCLIVKILGKRQEPEVSPALIKIMLNDPEVPCQETAAEVLLARKHEIDVNIAFMQVLRSDCNETVKVTATKALKDDYSQAATNALIKTWKKNDNDPYLDRSVLGALCNRKGKAVLDIFLDAADNCYLDYKEIRDGLLMHLSSCDNKERRKFITDHSGLSQRLAVEVYHKQKGRSAYMVDDLVKALGNAKNETNRNFLNDFLIAQIKKFWTREEKILAVDSANEHIRRVVRALISQEIDMWGEKALIELLWSESNQWLYSNAKIALRKKIKHYELSGIARLLRSQLSVVKELATEQLEQTLASCSHEKLAQIVDYKDEYIRTKIRETFRARVKEFDQQRVLWLLKQTDNAFIKMALIGRLNNDQDRRYLKGAVIG